MTRKRIFLIILIAFSGLYFLGLWYLNSKDPLLIWDWSSIDAREKKFPDGFIWGVASAAHQVEGGHQDINNFGWWEKQTKEDGTPTIINNDKSGDACDHWNLFPSDIKLIKNLNVDAYRFSVSWSKIMPKKGKVDTVALMHYAALIDSLYSHGIEPMVTLHHFTHPLWFHEMGGFEKEENISYFVDFSEIVFSFLGEKVTQWCTINEPGVYMFDAYFSGMFPPGIHDPILAARVLENLLKAHVKVYNRIKSLPGGNNTKIGIVKNMMQMDAYGKYNLFDHIIKFIADHNYNEVVLEALKTDRFQFNMPTIINYETSINGCSNSLDFIGLNYYSHYAFNFTGNLDESLEPKPYPGESMTDMDYGIYPEGIYRAIKRISSLNVPIIITENGIADDKDDRRADYIDRTLYAVSQAIQDGYDVRGYYYWSLMDNFEWNLGYGKRFGLYKVDYTSQERTLRNGAKKYQRIISDSKHN